MVAELTECEFLHDGRCLLQSKIKSRNVVTDFFVEEGTQGLAFVHLTPLRDMPIPDDGVSSAAVSAYVARARALISRLPGAYVAHDSKVQ